MENDVGIVYVVDLLAAKMDCEADLETKKLYQKLINKIDSCSSAPLNTKHALRMQPFSGDTAIYDAAVEIIMTQKYIGLHGYPPEFAIEEYAKSGQMYWSHTPSGFGMRFLDRKGYWYLMALLVCDLSDEAEQVIAEMISEIVDKDDYMLMNRTLGFFSNDKTARLKEQLEGIAGQIMNR